jgi:hypothetical protein
LSQEGGLSKKEEKDAGNIIPFWIALDGVSVFLIDPVSTAIQYSSVSQERRIGPVGTSLLLDHQENGDSVLTESGLKLFNNFLKLEKLFKPFVFNLRRYTENHPPGPLVLHVEIMMRLAENLTFFIDIDPRKVSRKMIKCIYDHTKNQAIQAFKKLDMEKVVKIFNHSQHMEMEKTKKNKNVG